jgi:N utilization substance protein B
VAREVAFQFLYQDDLNPPKVGIVQRPLDDYELVRFVSRLLQELIQDDDSPAQVATDVEAFKKWREAPVMVEFSRTLVVGVRLHRDKIDQTVGEVAENWSLDRMTATDRNVLRLGAYEILYSETPGRVVINEAVELAKRYGTAQSAQFVNGILDRLLRMREPKEETSE